MRIIKIGTDIAEKYLENIPSFSQAATYIFRKFQKAPQWIPIPNKLQSLIYKSPLGNVCHEDYSEHPTIDRIVKKIEGEENTINLSYAV